MPSQEKITSSPDGSFKRFLVDALGGALEHGFAVPDDVLKHVTPDVLAEHLPRPLWAKLITACLAAPKVDARLIVDTIGVADLCANVPATLLWQVIADVAARALGKGLLASPPPAEKEKAADKAVEKSEKPERSDEKPARSGHVTGSWSGGEERPVVARPATGPAFASRPATSPGTPIAGKPAVSTTPATGIPEVTRSPDGSRNSAAPASGSGRASTVTSTQTSAAPVPVAVDIFFEDDDEPEPLDAPPVSPHRAQTVRPGTSGNGARAPVGAGASSRRPQATATGTPAPTPRTKPRTMPPSGRRGASANSDFDLDTDVGTNEKQPEELPVDDDQLVDWSASEETVTSGRDNDRKR